MEVDFLNFRGHKFFSLRLYMILFSGWKHVQEFCVYLKIHTSANSAQMKNSRDLILYSLNGYDGENRELIVHSVLSVRFQVQVPFPLVENAGIKLAIRKRVPAEAPAGAGSYWKHCHCSWLVCYWYTRQRHLVIFKWPLFIRDNWPVFSYYLF